MSNEPTALAVQPQTLPQTLPHPYMLTGEAHSRLMAWARSMANSELVPQAFRGKADSVLVALSLAEQMQMPPLMVLQNVVIIKGTPGWKAQFVVALLNRSGRFRGPLRWTTSGKGESLAVTCWALLAEDGERIEVTVPLSMARAERWGVSEKGTNKYDTMPEQMLRWRSATFLGRLYAPEVLLGMYDSEELSDIQSARGTPVGDGATYEPPPEVAPLLPRAVEMGRLVGTDAARAVLAEHFGGRRLRELSQEEQCQFANRLEALLADDAAKAEQQETTREPGEEG
jgi:hypothetical protein